MPPEESLRNVHEVSGGTNNLQLEPCDSLPSQDQSPLRDGNDSVSSASGWLKHCQVVFLMDTGRMLRLQMERGFMLGKGSHLFQQAWLAESTKVTS